MKGSSLSGSNESVSGMHGSRIQTALCVLLTLLSGFCWSSTATDTRYVRETNTSLKILGVFGHPGKSHFDVFLPVLEELSRRGHEVTVLSFYPRSPEDKAREPLPNYKDVSLIDEKVGLFRDVVDLSRVDQSVLRLFHELRNLRRMANVACRTGLNNPGVKDLMRSDRTFDVILTENFNTDCFLSIVQKFKAPYLSISSHQIMPWASSRFGDPFEASYVPSVFQGLPRPLNFVGRLINTLTLLVTTTTYDTWYHSLDQTLVQEAFGPGMPDLKEVSGKSAALLLNTHHSIHGLTPHLPNVVEIGGIHIPKKPRPLPADIGRFLDEAEEGVLYFNLGSMVKASSMRNETLAMILNVIGSIPRKVIWKWEADALPHRPKNLLVRKWLPQFDILSHRNVRCYFGHGGLLGLSEGVYNGVPMILTPIFGDQFHNAAAAEARGAAVVIRFLDLTEENLRRALNDVFNKTKYRENARRLSKAYRDRPVGPLETAVWWTEHVARGDGLPYLRSEAANLPWYQRHLLDVGLFLLLLPFALLWFAYRLSRLLLPVLLRSGMKSNASGERGRAKKKD